MPAEPKPYPQREAVLFALRALTGKDVGPTTGAWLDLIGLLLDPEPEVAEGARQAGR